MASDMIPMPQSVAEVEQLIQQLYQPGNPQLITQIQAQLQTLQRSHDGWQMAHTLLSSEDVHVRFFAALTCTVKLNNDGDSLSEDHALQLREGLVAWLVRRSAGGEGALVLKKLCSTLATYFLRSPVPWDQPISDVAGAFIGAAVGTGADMTISLKQLTPAQLVVMYWFSETIADEVGKTETSSQVHQKYHDRMEQNVQIASRLMYLGLTDTGPEASRLRTEALKCFLTWAFYAQSVWSTRFETLQQLRNLILPAMHCLSIEELRDEAINVFRDLLENYPSFMQQDHLTALAGVICYQIGPRCLEYLRDEDPDSMLTAQLIVAYGNAAVQGIAETPEGDGVKAVKDLLLNLLRGPGWPGQDDDVSVLAVEFWNTYVEHVSDALFSSDSDHPAWLPAAHSTLIDAVETFWRKLWMPPVAVMKQWGESQKSGFGAFRTDVNDFMQSSFIVLGISMVRLFADLTLRSIKAREWRAVEAGLYCLNGLADLVADDSSFDEELATVFGSSLFADMADFTNTSISPRTRKTAVDTLGCYGLYIERSATFLPSALTFLFSSLKTAALANIAAKSISSLCFSCRHSLTGELVAFVEQYQSFLLGGTAEQYTKEKVIGAIAAIIQAMPNEQLKVAPLSALLQTVERDIQIARDSKAAGEAEMAEYAGVTALQCLASIGKALQIPDDVPVNVDDEGHRTAPNFWNTPEGQAVQQRITSCLSILDVIGSSGEAIEAACLVLKSGFAETVPGPFVLPPSVTVSFVRQTRLTTPHLEAVLAAACILITQHSRQAAVGITNEVAAIFHHVASFVLELADTSREPEIATSCIDILARLIPRYVDVLLNLHPEELVERVLEFTISGLTGTEPLPKRSATVFWQSFIQFTKSCKTALGPQEPIKCAAVMLRFGPQLCLALMTQMGGNAQRSELEYLCEPLKALITQQPQSKQWLEAALLHPSFPSSRVGVAEKRRFLQQIAGLRGDKRTKDVVKDFWIVCRGTVRNFG